MSGHPLLPNPSCLTLESIGFQNGGIVLAVRTVTVGATCPCCGRLSERVHSRYRRTLLDLPWQGNAVRIVLSVRKFFCDNRDCARRVFAERLPAVAQRYARKTARLAEALRELAYLAGGEAAARIARTFGLLISPDALLESLRRSPVLALPTPRVLGVDDFAFKRGHVYGTILVDLEQHSLVDLLPNRQAETLAAWLKAHPGVEVISRDRAGAYADGARQGAPEAIQVADRWHLLHNAVETLERLLGRHHRHLREAAHSAAQIAPEEKLGEGASAPVAVEPRVPNRAQRESEARREKRLERVGRVRELQEQGASIRAIAEALCMARRTVRRILRAGTLADAVSEKSPRRPRPNQLGAFAPYLRQRWEEGCHNAAQLWREIKERGFRGCSSALRPYLARWRIEPPTELGPKRGKLPNRLPARTAPSPRSAAWLLLGYGRTQDVEEQAFNAAFVARLCASCGEVKTAQALAREFFRIVRHRRAGELESWLAAVAASQIAELASFAAGLARDKAAVAAGLSQTWSNAQTEGQVNRLKFVKRQMYGRAGFDLLRARVLHAA